VNKTLFVHPTPSTPTSLSPLQLRGPGYRLPIDSSFSPLPPNSPLPTASEMAEAVDLFYSLAATTTPTAITFGGGHSEPLSALDATISTMESIRESRHGVPFVLQTNGLCATSAPTIAALDAAFRDEPGSDGLSKLQVWVELGAGQPPLYEQILKPVRPDGTKVPGPAAFGQVCSFISTLVESGVTVYATASHHPLCTVKHMNETKGLATALGCAGFFARSYHERTLYDVLGVTDEADGKAIKNAYRAKAKELHPDVNPAEEAAGLMEEVTEAYGVLGDEELRRLYDVEGVADLVMNADEEDFYGAVSGKSM